MTVQMTDAQFKELISTIKAIAPDPTIKSKGSFGKCNTRFNGQLDHDAVEIFITAIETYKDVEEINDKDALKGIYLLFTGQAALWWKGIRRDVKTWEDAVRLLREHFSPVKPPYQIYMDFFEGKQDDEVTIDAFVCEKRALLCQLPEGTHNEETELNFIYGLLNVKYRQHIPRHEVKTFKELLERGRKLEETNR